MSGAPDLARLSEALTRLRNADGGWGYAPGKTSRIEPTCWATLAIARAANAPITADVLGRWPRHDGWLVDVSGAPVNYAFNALAALALRTNPAGVPAARDIANLLTGVRGLKLGQGTQIRQDNSLQAWPWIDGTFSWAEPTSLCLLLLKALRAQLPTGPAQDRITVGERMLLDRACSAGGWNYGGSNVYGQELYAYVPTTALGLLAMQDRAMEPAVVQALAWLQREATSESSAYALALAAIALRVHRIPSPDLERVLERRADQTIAHANILGMATSLYALARSLYGETTFAL